MKLNQSEKDAISCLRRVLDRLEAGEEMDIATSEVNAIKKILGIDLKEATFKKKDVAKFVRGKDDFHLTFSAPFSPWSDKNRIRPFGYFPFQIKEFKPSKNVV